MGAPRGAPRSPADLTGAAAPADSDVHKAAIRASAPNGRWIDAKPAVLIWVPLSSIDVGRCDAAYGIGGDRGLTRVKHWRSPARSTTISVKALQGHREVVLAR